VLINDPNTYTSDCCKAKLLDALALATSDANDKTKYFILQGGLVCEVSDENLTGGLCRVSEFEWFNDFDLISPHSGDFLAALDADDIQKEHIDDIINRASPSSINIKVFYKAFLITEWVDGRSFPTINHVSNHPNVSSLRNTGTSSSSVCYGNNIFPAGDDDLYHVLAENVLATQANTLDPISHIPDWHKGQCPTGKIEVSYYLNGRRVSKLIKASRHNLKAIFPLIGCLRPTFTFDESTVRAEYNSMDRDALPYDYDEAVANEDEDIFFYSMRGDACSTEACSHCPLPCFMKKNMPIGAMSALHNKLGREAYDYLLPSKEDMLDARITPFTTGGLQILNEIRKDEGLPDEWEHGLRALFRFNGDITVDDLLQIEDWMPRSSASNQIKQFLPAFFEKTEHGSLRDFCYEKSSGESFGFAYSRPRVEPTWDLVRFISMYLSWFETNNLLEENSSILMSREEATRWASVQWAKTLASSSDESIKAQALTILKNNVGFSCSNK